MVGSRELQDLSMKERHGQWMSLHGRAYTDEAKRARHFVIFERNVQFIETFNRDGDKSYRLGINEFSDITNGEFRGTRNGYKKFPPRLSECTSFKYENVTAVPSNMDWRKKGVMTPIRDQQQCGSCWVFSAVAAMEGITQLATGKLISLSEQGLIDCDVKGEDQGCEGSLMDDAFHFIIENHGLTTETNYEGIDGPSKRSKEASHVASIKGYEDVPVNNEAALLKAAAHQPISVANDASVSEFMSYSGGIFRGPCGTDLDHGVTVVGYGATADGIKSWLVKISWGESWGESGCIRMKRDVAMAEGLCGIAMQASHPTS